MCREVRHFKVPIGKEGVTVTMGDLIDKTPKDMISKVMLEEKLFETWFGGRTVLLGDGTSFFYIFYFSCEFCLKSFNCPNMLLRAVDTLIVK